MALSLSFEKDLPQGLSARRVISSLHNHDLVIKSICPQLISYERAPTDGTALGGIAYSVTDKKPIGQTTYKLTLINHPEGVDSIVVASMPIGALNVQSRWRVAGGKLAEEAEVEGNLLVKRMAKGTISKEHPEAMDRIIEESGKA